MEFTTEKIERARSNIVQTEQRIVRQRRRVEKMLVERHPADEAKALLMVMEQSLLLMNRFLQFLERDLEAELSLNKHQTQNRIKAQNKTDSPPADKIEKLANDFASRATALVLKAGDLKSAQAAVRAGEKSISVWSTPS